MAETAAGTLSQGDGEQSTAGQTQDTAQDKAKEVASQAQDRAREAAGEARGRLREQVDQRSTELGERIGSGAGEARSVADELRKQGKDTPARYVEQAADRVERLGGYLENKDGDSILNDVEDFARRNPWAVAAGGLFVGFAASRMLKASSGERYRTGRPISQSRSTSMQDIQRPGDGAAVGTGAGPGVGTGFDPGR